MQLTARRSFRSFGLLGTLAVVLPILAWLTVMKPGVIAAGILAAPVAYLLLWTLTKPLEHAVLSYLIVYALADSLKRVVVIFAPDVPLAQYVPFGFKLLLLLVIGARGLGQRINRSKIDAIDGALLTFIGFTLVGVLAASDATIKAKLVMIPFLAGPYLAFFAFREAFAVPGWAERVLKTVVLIAVVAACYGLYQYWYGPSWIDREWARVSNTFSIQAENVWRAVIKGETMRPYAFFGDHFGYGYFLVAGLIALGAGTGLARPWAKSGAVFVITLGLAFAMTRTAWVAIAMAIGCVGCLRYANRLRGLVWVGLLSLYLLLTGAIEPLYERIFPAQRFSTTSAADAFSVGTLAARRDGLTAMGRALQRYPLIGDAGAASGSFFIASKFSGDLAGVKELERFDDAHNFLVDKVVKTGACGLIAFLVFFVLLIRRAGVTKRSRWALAGASGLFLAGVAGSATILAGWFVAWCALSLESTEGSIEPSSRDASPVGAAVRERQGNAHG